MLLCLRGGSIHISTVALAIANFILGVGYVISAVYFNDAVSALQADGAPSWLQILLWTMPPLVVMCALLAVLLDYQEARRVRSLLSMIVPTLNLVLIGLLAAAVMLFTDQYAELTHSGSSNDEPYGSTCGAEMSGNSVNTGHAIIASYLKTPHYTVLDVDPQRRESRCLQLKASFISWTICVALLVICQFLSLLARFFVARRQAALLETQPLTQYAHSRLSNDVASPLSHPPDVFFEAQSYKAEAVDIKKPEFAQVLSPVASSGSPHYPIYSRLGNNGEVPCRRAYPSPTAYEPPMKLHFQQHHTALSHSRNNHNSDSTSSLGVSARHAVSPSNRSVSASECSPVLPAVLTSGARSLVSLNTPATIHHHRVLEARQYEHNVNACPPDLSLPLMPRPGDRINADQNYSSNNNNNNNNNNNSHLSTNNSNNNNYLSPPEPRPNRTREMVHVLSIGGQTMFAIPHELAGQQSPDVSNGTSSHPALRSLPNSGCPSSHSTTGYRRIRDYGTPTLQHSGVRDGHSGQEQDGSAHQPTLSLSFIGGGGGGAVKSDEDTNNGLPNTDSIVRLGGIESDAFPVTNVSLSQFEHSNHSLSLGSSGDYSAYLTQPCPSPVRSVGHSTNSTRAPPSRSSAVTPYAQLFGVGTDGANNSKGSGPAGTGGKQI